MNNNYCDISASCKIVNKLKAESESIIKTVDGLLKVQYTLAESCNKYFQALSEIKQLSDRIVNSDDLLLWDVYELNEQISQKISEVQNENEKRNCK